MLQKVYVGR